MRELRKEIKKHNSGRENHGFLRWLREVALGGSLKPSRQIRGGRRDDALSMVGSSPLRSRPDQVHQREV